MTLFLHINADGHPGFYSDESGPAPPLDAEPITAEFRDAYFAGGAGSKIISGSPGDRFLEDRPRPSIEASLERARRALSDKVEKAHKQNPAHDLIRREIFYPDSVSSGNGILTKIMLRTKESRPAAIARLTRELSEKDAATAEIFDKESAIIDAIAVAKNFDDVAAIYSLIDAI